MHVAAVLALRCNDLSSVQTHRTGGRMSDDSTQLIGLSDGFSSFYRADDGDWEGVLSSGWIAVDTNALLDLYRLSPPAREELFSVLEALSSRLFVPHHVAAEFHRRRLDAVADRIDEVERAANSLRDQQSKVRGLLRSVSRRAHAGDAAIAELQARFDAAFEAASDFIGKVNSEYDLTPEILLTKQSDPVLRRLEILLAGRVANRPSYEQIQVDLAEGKVRADARKPPGFKDATKDENPFGDYLWWAEVVRYAAEQPAHVLLVCNDVAKGDWTYDKRGFRIGPATGLVDEIFAATGRRLLLCTTAELLDRAAAHLEIQISDRTVSETRNLPSRFPRHRDSRNIRIESVPTVWLGDLLGFDAELLRPWADNGELDDLDAENWRWLSVRKAAYLREAADQGVAVDYITTIMDALDDRPAGKTQLVLTAESCEWVRKRDLADYVAELPKEPIAIFDNPQIERMLRSRQSKLAAIGSSESQTDRSD